MLYEKYYNKISKVAEIFRVIRKFRVLIIVLISTAVASTVGYTATQGIVYDKEECPTSVVYGEALSYEARALFEEIERYEYSTDDAFGEPLSEMPKLPGVYYVRAVSTSSIGTPRYGKVHSFEIVPKQAEVWVSQQTVLYGEMPTEVDADLVEGDTISCTGFSYADITVAQTEVVPQKDTLKVVDAQGNDVTSGYDFQVFSVPISFEKRQIQVTVSSASQEYNALPLSINGYELTSGTFASWQEGNLGSLDCNL